MDKINSKSTANDLNILSSQPVLKVVGLGGGGSNAINRMIEFGLTGIDFIAANTDAQALKDSLAPTKIILGKDLLRGLGAGGDLEVGFKAAQASIQQLLDALEGADMVFLAAGMGGGTGTGSISIAAQVAKQIGAVTVAIVTTPFSFEVGRRQKNAQEGLNRLRAHVDTLITIPNDRLIDAALRDLTLDMAFRLADDVLRQGIQGISELINQTGYINVDFSHIRQMMKMGGGSMLSIGMGKGKDKAKQAIYNALNHPLLETVDISNATGIIANFTAGDDLTFIEMTEALRELHEMTETEADIIPGVLTDSRLQDRCEVILVITGLGATPLPTAHLTTTGTTRNIFEPAAKPAACPAYPSPQMAEIMPNTTDIDIPAFLRKRQRAY